MVAQYRRVQVVVVYLPRRPGWPPIGQRMCQAPGPIADREHSLREFVFTGFDGNRVRFGGPVG
jgi:hypothetical protein